MKKRFLCFVLAICAVLTCAVSLTACDFGFGGEKADPTLYHLTLTTSANVTLSDAQKAELKAEFGHAERDADDKDALLDAGATQADIDKAGVRQEDGTYYFFDADPIYLHAPDVEGYNFVGFFPDGGNDVFSFANNNPQNWWNMLQKDTVVEARYEFLKYDITYVDMNGVIANPTNPTTYNGEEKVTVTLTDPAKIDGYVFKYWYYREILPDSTTRMVPCTELPKVGNENIVNTVGTDASGKPVYGLTLFAEYERAALPEYTITLDCDEVEGLVVSVSYYEGDEITFGEAAVKVQQGTQLDIYVDTSALDPNYEFDGIYLNGVKVEDVDLGGGLTRPSNREMPIVTADMTIEIKAKPV